MNDDLIEIKNKCNELSSQNNVLNDTINTLSKKNDEQISILQKQNSLYDEENIKLKTSLNESNKNINELKEENVLFYYFRIN